MNIDEKLRKSLERILGYGINTISLNEDDLIDMLDEIVQECEHLEEELEDLKQNIEENYRPIPVAEQYGISERDFY